MAVQLQLSMLIILRHFNDEGKLLIGIVSTGTLNAATSVWVSYDYVDPSMVTADDIVGGVDTER